MSLLVHIFGQVYSCFREVYRAENTSLHKVDNIKHTLHYTSKSRKQTNRNITTTMKFILHLFVAVLKIKRKEITFYCSLFFACWRALDRFFEIGF